MLGLVLGPMAEVYFVESVEMAAWDFSIFFTRPITIVLWICMFAVVFGSGFITKMTGR